MSRPVHLATASALLLCSPLSAMAQSFVGINGSTCAFSSVQAALNASSSPSTLWIASGYHTDPGFVVDRDVTIQRGDSSCATGGSGLAALDFEGGGHAVIQDDRRVTLRDLSLLNGVGSSGGNLLIGEDADVSMHHVSLSFGEADTGGGVAVGSGTRLEVYGGLWWGNTATAQGGALFADSGSDIELKSGLGVDLTLLDNTGSHGGGVYCWQCTLAVYSPYGDELDFQGNEATGASGEGGALWVEDGAAAVSDATFSGNSAAYGGAVYLSDSAVSDFSDLDFDGNDADVGGAVYLTAIGTFEPDYVDFTGNSATWDGGAVYGISSDFDADHGLWEGNVAERGAGLFLIASSGSFSSRIRHSTMRENEATEDTTGSAIDLHGSGHSFTLANSLVYGNLSDAAPGGAVVAQSGATVEVKDSTVAHNQRWGVAALSGSSGTLSGAILWGNGAGGVTGTGTASCSDVQGLTASGDNINVDPGFTDPSNGDFTISNGTDAWDGCDPHAATALNGVSRATGRSDMGAYDH